MNNEQLKLIKEIFLDSENKGIPLWLDSGWSVDARLGKITREHEDIDIIFPLNRKSEYLDVLTKHGFGGIEEMDYGFIVHKGPILIDSEPCNKIGLEYNVGGYPKGSCPNDKEGALEGYKVRCTSWEKMYFEYLYLIKQVKREDWKPKHFTGLEIMNEHILPSRRKELEQQFALIQ